MQKALDIPPAGRPTDREIKNKLQNSKDLMGTRLELRKYNFSVMSIEKCYVDLKNIFGLIGK